MNRLYWTLALLVVFFLILGTNRIDQMHFERLKDSLESVYKDRLVVKDYIYDIALNLERKNLEASLGNQAFFGRPSRELSSEIDTLVALFSVSELTRREEQMLNRFKEDGQKLRSLATAYATADEDQVEDHRARVLAVVGDMKTTLQVLSDIQIKEGKIEMMNANKSIKAINLFTRIEIIFLVLIGLVIQTLIVIKTSKPA